jgi:NADH:ubiquinone oxidoreductase subunit 5 (subunit L)/multisubunit Na+/H+ antiporter MnhA subunit
MNTRRYTHRYLAAFALMFVADLVALMLSDNLVNSLAFLVLLTINLWLLVRYTS